MADPAADPEVSAAQMGLRNEQLVNWYRQQQGSWASAQDLRNAYAEYAAMIAPPQPTPPSRRCRLTECREVATVGSPYCVEHEANLQSWRKA